MTKFVTCENWFIKHMIHEICQNLQVKQDHDLGIHIPSHAVIPDDCNLVWTIQITSKVALWTSEVLLNHKIFSKIFMILYIFPVFWILLIHSKLLEKWRITSSFCLQWNRKFGCHLWWCSIFNETIAGLVFCEVLYSEAIRRKCESTHQDVAFLRRHFVAFSGKKGQEEGGAIYASRCDVFLEDNSLSSTENKETQEPLLCTGKHVSTPSCPHGELWQTMMWLLVKHK